MTDDQLPPEEVSRRLAIAVSVTHDLLHDVRELLRSVKEGVEAEADVTTWAYRNFRVPVRKSRKGHSVEHLLSYDLGMLFELDVSDEIDDSDEESEAEVEKEGPGIQISEASQFLAVRALLFPGPGNERKGFVPRITYGLFSELKRRPAGRKSTGSEETNFSTKRKALILLLKSLVPELKDGTVLSSAVPGSKYTTRLDDVSSKPLAELDGQESVEKLVVELLALANSGGAGEN